MWHSSRSLWVTAVSALSFSSYSSALTSVAFTAVSSVGWLWKSAPWVIVMSSLPFSSCSMGLVSEVFTAVSSIEEWCRCARCDKKLRWRWIWSTVGWSRSLAIGKRKNWLWEKEDLYVAVKIKFELVPEASLDCFRHVTTAINLTLIVKTSNSLTPD